MNALSHEQALALCQDRSMFNKERWNLLCKVVEEPLPPGQVHEFGVARGGVTGYLALRLPNRTIQSYCRFDKGCTAPHEKDGACHLVEGSLADVSRDDVYRWLVEIHAHMKVHLLQTDVRKLNNIPCRIALAVIDVNLYEPTLSALQYVLPNLQPGGVLLVDDVEYPGVTAALNECGWPWARDGYMAVLRRQDAEGI